MGRRSQKSERIKQSAEEGCCVCAMILTAWNDDAPRWDPRSPPKRFKLSECGSGENWFIRAGKAGSTELAGRVLPGEQMQLCKSFTSKRDATLPYTQISELVDDLHRLQMKEKHGHEHQAGC